MQNQQMQTQKPATDSHQANSPVKSSTDMQSAQTNSSRVPPQPTASGRQPGKLHLNCSNALIGVVMLLITHMYLNASSSDQSANLAIEL